MRRLSSVERGKLQSALTAAFPEPNELAMVMSLGMDKSLASLVSLNQSYELVAFRLIQATEARGWTADLIIAACASREGNPDLSAIAESLGLVPQIPANLEVTISQRSGMHDIAEWRAELWRTEGRVCRVQAPHEDGGVRMGSGFLIAPDIVMTNHHVIAHVVKGHGDPANVKLHFDFKRDADSALINAGVQYGLAEEWLVASSPSTMPSASATGRLPSLDELDFALLRLDEPVGETTVGGVADAPGVARRGWVQLAAEPPSLDEGLPIVIVQHPEGAPLKIAMDTVLRMNENSTRVLYRTNTSGGSSGSPCFDLDWRLVALHQAGNDSSANPEGQPFNQGVPMRAIAAQLATSGVLTGLGS